MRKLILIGLALVMLSCRAFVGFEPTFTMGMSESDFKKKNKPELVAANEDGTRIYSTYHASTDFKFFFFRNEKLVRFEKGKNADDYQLLRY
ncbi:hypothetical protein [Pedobacter miscanthi]|jgi:hypothetical protein|uniref:hypothetical protein n=1 Tax=Pedobacter miscanthi TaxID=2259170 RepID=UPI00292D976A|nr:hypothetical protein [Pedobacter miscanthi]